MITIKDEAELIELAIDVLTRLIIHKESINLNHVEVCESCATAYKRNLVEEQIIRSYLTKKGFPPQ